MRSMKLSRVAQMMDADEEQSKMVPSGFLVPKIANRCRDRVPDRVSLLTFQSD